jgi:ABC-2 type transport system ATP-binding protein
MLAIEAIDLTKHFGDGSDAVEAVRGIRLAVHPGEIYALLGPNGAGKTTTLAMLMTLLTPTAGMARVAGYDVVAQSAEVRRCIGVTFQEIVLDQELSGRQVLDFHGRLYGLGPSLRRERIEALATLVELSEALDRKVAHYSGGMKRRLELIRGLLTQPQILFLDEPTQGLDPQNRINIWGYIRTLRDETGLTLVLTTHSMEEAETLADRVGIIDNGELIIEGTPDELIRQLGADVVSLRGTGESAVYLQALGNEPYVIQATEHPAEDSERQIQIGVDAGDRRWVSLIALASASGFHLSEATVHRPTLADVFLAHTGHALRAADR